MKDPPRTSKRIWVLAVGGLDTQDLRAFGTLDAAIAAAVRLLRKLSAFYPPGDPRPAAKLVDQARAQLKAREFVAALGTWNALCTNYFASNDGLRLNSVPFYGDGHA